MHLESEDLVNQFRNDWPDKAEVSTLRLLSAKQDAEIARLTAENERLTTSQAGAFPLPASGSGTYTSTPRPYVLQNDGDADGGRHG